MRQLLSEVLGQVQVVLESLLRQVMNRVLRQRFLVAPRQVMMVVLEALRELRIHARCLDGDDA